MLFYKYQRPGELQFNMLRRGEIYFAAANELNDANECQPHYVFRGSEELWQRFAQFVFESICFQEGYRNQFNPEQIRQVMDLSRSVGSLLKKHAGNRDVGIAELTEAFTSVLEKVLLSRSPELRPSILIPLTSAFIANDLRSILDEDKYMASFSMDATNPTMWGHYAGAEKGFVVVYGTDDGTIHVWAPTKVLHGCRQVGDDTNYHEIGIYREDHLQLKNISYSRRPPKVNGFHRLVHQFTYTEAEYHYDVPLNLGVEEKQGAFNGLVKYSDWRYEKEIRAFFPTNEKQPPDVRVLSVSANNIKGLIFGPLMSKNDRIRAIVCCQILKECPMHPKSSMRETKLFPIFQATRNIDRFGFKLFPLGTIEGPYYGGTRLPLKLFHVLKKPLQQYLTNMAAEISGQNAGLKRSA